MFKKICIVYAVIFGMSMLWSLNLQAKELKIGVVDFTRAMKETEGKGQLAELQKQFKKREKKLKKMEKEFKKIEQEMKDNFDMWSEEKKKEQAMIYQKKGYELQQTLMSYEKEMADKRAKVMGEIQTRMTELALEIAKEKKLDMMIEANVGGMIYFKDSMDYTNELIKRYKKKYKGKKKKK